MYNHKGLIACIVACLSVSIALACGPDFPWQLLTNRAGTLKAAPANSFAFEAVRLAPKPEDQLKAVEDQFYTEEEPISASLARAETEDLSTDQAAMVQQMREADNGEEAFDKGAEVPMSIRLYTAGAVEFHQGEVTHATAWFQAVLQLPDNDQRARATWATYMLGRSYGLADDVEKATEAFTLVRDLAIKGAPDPLGLAVASYGEEAKLHLDKANRYLVGDELPATETAEYALEIATAVGLYAQQAARESTSGIQSLRIVARQLLSTPTRLAAAIADPIVQRLLLAYVLARFSDRPASFYESYAEHELGGKPNQLVTLVEAIEQRGLDHPTGADRLAALAYRIGRYDLAAHLAANAPGPLASWVKAKLALQKGELAAAAAFYAEASQAFPSSDDATPLDEGNIRLLGGEGGVLALARGEYVDALAQLYPLASTYWGDVVHLAERVLTVDELKRFVDAKVLASSMANPRQSRAEGGIPSVEGINWLATNPAAQLQDLLARRLVREGRYEEALGYFHAPDNMHFSDPDAKKHVADYAQALHAARTRWWAIDRARAWYQAAVLVRKSGMGMMGYEAAPDFFAMGGFYGFGIGQDALGDSFVTDGERQRFSASAAKPDRQFHYRYIAVDHTTHAADLLPPRSQAFAAVLCQATGWMMSTQGAQERVHDLYRRYVEQGPYVAWAVHFGRNCPEPDFAAAVRLARTQPFRDARRVASHYRWPIGLGFVGVTSLALTWLVRRRKASAGYARQR